MAGRGCTIVIKVLGGSTGNGEVEDLSLPVALHSPLQVLKEQLMDIIGIPTQAQVLILCDLSDPDRNSDVLLNGRDFDTLRACGIRNGSTLTLHALGISAEQQQKLTRDAMSNKAAPKYPNDRPRFVLSTPITAAEANHSYNGVIFDVECTGPFEIELLSVSIAGMLGRVRIYARDRPWEDQEAPPVASQHYWAHRESVSPAGWTKIADRTCRPSWDKPVEIMFDQPVVLLPHTCRALYCHSALQDDLGIQYQAYKKSAIVAEDDHLIIRPGLGHTGSEPFDETHGWYRAHRALAGSITYTAQRKGWTPFEHRIFPAPLKEAVVSLLMCHNHDNYVERTSPRTPSSPSAMVPSSPQGASAASTAPFTSSNNDNNNNNNGSGSRKRGLAQSSGDAGEEEDQVVTKMSADDPDYQRPFAAPEAPPNPVPVSSADPGNELVASLNDNLATSSDSGPANIEQRQRVALTRLAACCSGRKLSELPVSVIYNILEYVHWDWFEERYESEEDALPANSMQASLSPARKKGPKAEAGSTNERGLLYRLLAHMNAMHGGGQAGTHNEEMHEQLNQMFGYDHGDADPEDSDDGDMWSESAGSDEDYVGSESGSGTESGSGGESGGDEGGPHAVHHGTAELGTFIVPDDDDSDDPEYLDSGFIEEEDEEEDSGDDENSYHTLGSRGSGGSGGVAAGQSEPMDVQGASQEDRAAGESDSD